MPPDNKTFHFVFPQDLHSQDLLHPIIVLVRSAASSNNTELARFSAIGGLMSSLQLVDVLQALLDLAGFELDKV